MIQKKSKAKTPGITATDICKIVCYLLETNNVVVNSKRIEENGNTRVTWYIYKRFKKEYRISANEMETIQTSKEMFELAYLIAKELTLYPRRLA